MVAGLLVERHAEPGDPFIAGVEPLQLGQDRPAQVEQIVLAIALDGVQHVLDDALAPALPLDHQPVVEATIQPLQPVQYRAARAIQDTGQPGQVVGGGAGQYLAQVAGKATLCQMQVTPFDLDERGGRMRTQVGQRLAQAGAGLHLAPVAPQQADQPVATGATVGFQREMGEQGTGLAAARAMVASVRLVDQAEIAEQSKAKPKLASRCHHHALYCWRPAVPGRRSIRPNTAC